MHRTFAASSPSHPFILRQTTSVISPQVPPGERRRCTVRGAAGHQDRAGPGDGPELLAAPNLGPGHGRAPRAAGECRFPDAILLTCFCLPRLLDFERLLRSLCTGASWTARGTCPPRRFSRGRSSAAGGWSSADIPWEVQLCTGPMQCLIFVVLYLAALSA